jgi:hypothetical protein
VRPEASSRREVFWVKAHGPREPAHCADVLPLGPAAA